ncbi:DUF1294 domain-containing protein [Neoroseomonas lacus]|uniref:DUF1294 domain-containing protein n=1 Tax=Neoroseomonas lacus TaxID=287609 RepID=A0A917KAF1_9PROT|nr:DUF1294 domain-containing protein [Neoroseomonas lacus]GGJ06756.1 hypothetical protein GCM10011320_12110 [Neoroseomonas lacus]
MPGDALFWALGTGCWLLVANSLAVIAFHHDKRMAQAGGWRISEQTLLMLALLGGSGGALLARQAFRHKTRKQPFGAQLHAIVGLQVFGLAGLGMYGVTMMVTPWVR